ncbi:thioesterase [Albitalea terrae]|uniref:Thioesterase n=2 Tax=Piscinibacter terrae TaxID=2496871 RepID=A0A3N7J359_9BURK|nr:thioesterase [Albitalea terrae]
MRAGEILLPSNLQQYLHAHIPLSAAMQVSVLELGMDFVHLAAPLAPNINHRETVFGGSASAVAILAAWSLLHVRMRAAGVDSRLVIQRNTMDYGLPIDGDFTARSSLAQPEQWGFFLRMLARKGKARIEVVSVLECAGTVVGKLSGEFVALGKSAKD